MDPLLTFKLASVFTASVAGSFHCASMCGGLVLSAGPRLAQQFYFQLFRLLGYVILGSIAGMLGAFISHPILPAEIELILAIGLAGILIYSGLHLFFKNSLPQIRVKLLSTIAQRGMQFGFTQKAHAQSACLGLFTALLPCGWLYAFLTIAATSHSPAEGGVILLFFWLGTVPILLGGRILLQGMVARLGRTAAFRGPLADRGIAILFVFAGFFSLYERIQALSHNPNSWSILCH